MREKSQLFPFSINSVFSQYRYQTKKISFPSLILQRRVILELIYPLNKLFHYQDCSFLFLNDGQDLKSLHFYKILEDLNRKHKLNNLITIAIHAGERLQEYGVSGIPDYLGRGSRAGDYQEFLIQELFPYIAQFFKVKILASKTAFIGFSLGGLSAFDFAWNHPEVVSRVGVFSGSFWWRTKALGPDYKDSDRIMHQKLENSLEKPNLKFWLQVGTLDEKNDRNQNGIIDSIDDTLDLIAVLESKEFLPEIDIHYLEVDGGEHNQETWSRVLPAFLEWAFIQDT